MDYFDKQERERTLRNNALPLHNKRYVIIYECEHCKVEVVGMDDEQLAHAMFDAVHEQVKAKLNRLMDHTGKVFEFSLHMWRCPSVVSKQDPNRWTVLMGHAVGHEGLVPVQVQATSGQYPLRGYDLEQFLGID